MRCVAPGNNNWIEFLPVGVPISECYILCFKLDVNWHTEKHCSGASRVDSDNVARRHIAMSATDAYAMHRAVAQGQVERLQLVEIVGRPMHDIAQLVAILRLIGGYRMTIVVDQHVLIAQPRRVIAARRVQLLGELGADQCRCKHGQHQQHEQHSAADQRALQPHGDALLRHVVVRQRLGFGGVDLARTAISVGVQRSEQILRLCIETTRTTLQQLHIIDTVHIHTHEIWKKCIFDFTFRCLILVDSQSQT
jgi:hypothetical protein